MTPTWGEECSDVLHLTSFYGPGGKHYEDGQIVNMMNAMPPVTTGMYAKQFLASLQEINARSGAEHPGSRVPRTALN